MSQLRIALFVEGSSSPPQVRGKPALNRIWNDDLASELNLHPFDSIIPISKKHLVAMDPRSPRMSGSEEPLDYLMARKLEIAARLNQAPFDVAVVAWDLVPAWNPEGEYCRWTETLDMYRFLADSQVLPDVWKNHARRKWQELAARHQPSDRVRLPPLEQGMVLAVCMEPMFESLLVQDEGAVKRALHVSETPRGWPRQGWGDPCERHPDAKILGPVIAAIKGVQPKLRCVRQIRGDVRTNKDGWGEYILRQLFLDTEARTHILRHPLPVRLVELLSRSRDG